MLQSVSQQDCSPPHRRARLRAVSLPSVQSFASSCRASVRLVAELQVRRVIVSDFGQLRVVRIHNSVSRARHPGNRSSVASQEQKRWVATSRRTA
jgi:hypothetical protein